MNENQVKAAVTNTKRGFYGALIDVLGTMVIAFYTILDQNFANIVNFQPEIMAQILRALGLTGLGGAYLSNLQSPATEHKTSVSVNKERPLSGRSNGPAPGNRPAASPSPPRPYEHTTLNQAKQAYNALTVNNSGYKLSQRSLLNLEEVHPHLVSLVTLALKYSLVDFGVTEGARSSQRQQKLFDEGRSTTLNSRHLGPVSHAVDVVAWIKNETGRSGVTWEPEYYDQIHAAFARAGQEIGVEFDWGGHWKTFIDRPHFQLPWDKYPVDKANQLT